MTIGDGSEIQGQNMETAVVKVVEGPEADAIEAISNDPDRLQIVKAVISYPEKYKHPKHFEEGQEVEITKEVHAHFSKLGIIKK